MQEYHRKQPQKVNVRVAIMWNKIIGVYFSDENVIGALYLDS